MKMVFGSAFFVFFISTILISMEELHDQKLTTELWTKVIYNLIETDSFRQALKNLAAASLVNQEFNGIITTNKKQLCEILAKKFDLKVVFIEVDDVLTQAAEDVALKDHFNYLNLGEHWLLRFGDAVAWVVGKVAGNKVREETHKISTLLMHVLSENHEFDDLKGDTQVLYRKRPLPSLWCAYYLNKITSEEAIKYAKETIAENTVDNKLHPKFHEFATQLNWDPNEEIRKYFDLAVEVGFDPKREVNYLKPIDDGFKLVRECAANSNNRLFAFSNKNTNTMNELIARYPEFFGLFEKIITSGSEGDLKPNQQFYKKIMEKYWIQTDHLYFIDSQVEYLNPATDLGENVRILEINPESKSDYDEALEDLIEQGFIKKAA